MDYYESKHGDRSIWSGSHCAKCGKRWCVWWKKHKNGRDTIAAAISLCVSATLSIAAGWLAGVLLGYGHYGVVARVLGAMVVTSVLMGVLTVEKKGQDDFRNN